MESLNAYFSQFTSSALPWIAVGVVLALLLNNGTKEGESQRPNQLLKTERVDQNGNFLIEGLALGTLIGFIASVLTGGGSLPLAIGMAAGTLVGSCIPKKPKTKK